MRGGVSWAAERRARWECPRSAPSLELVPAGNWGAAGATHQCKLCNASSSTATASESNGPLLKVVKVGTCAITGTHGSTWSVAPPLSEIESLRARGALWPPRGPWSSPGVLELQQPSTTHLPWILVWSSGPDSPLLLRWAQPQQVGDWSQAAESVLRTPRSRAWATSPGDAPVPFNTGTCPFPAQQLSASHAWGQETAPICQSPSPTSWGPEHPPASWDETRMCKSRRTSSTSTSLEQTAGLGAAGQAGLGAERQDGAVPRQRARGTAATGQMAQGHSGFTGALLSTVALLPETQQELQGSELPWGKRISHNLKTSNYSDIRE